MRPENFGYGRRLKAVGAVAQMGDLKWRSRRSGVRFPSAPPAQNLIHGLPVPGIERTNPNADGSGAFG